MVRAARPSLAALQSDYRRALALQKEGRAAEAEVICRRILAQQPGAFHPLHLLGALLGQRGDLEGSVQMLARAVQADPGAPAAHANLGNTLLRLDRAEEAEACFTRALAIDPRHAGGLKGLGMVRWMAHRHREALAVYETLLEVQPGFADGWIMKGLISHRLGLADVALASLRHALDIDGGSDPEKVRYILASMGSGPVPDAAPVEYVRGLFDRYAHRFDEHLVETLNYRGHERLIDALEPWLPEPPLDIVDLGCGTGLCGPLVAPWARSLVGVDISGGMLAEARHKGVYDELVESELVAWLAPRRAVADVMIASDVFNYLGDLEPAFAGVRQALRAGGRLAFTTEASATGEVELPLTMRFRHPAERVRELAVKVGFTVLAMHDQVLRSEGGKAQPGHLTVLGVPD